MNVEALLKQPRGLTGKKKLQAIIDSARRVVLAEGFDQARMSVIAAEAKVSTATVYAYFPGKDDLFRTVVERVGHDVEARLLDELATPDGDPIAKLARAVLHRMNDPDMRSLFRIMAVEGPRFPHVLKVFDSQTRLRAHQEAVALFEKLAAEDRFAPGQAETAARQLLGMLEHETLVLGVLRGKDTLAERGIDEIVAETVRTLRARFAPVA